MSDEFEYIYTKSWNDAFTMLYKIIQQFINDNGNVYYGKEASYLKAKKISDNFDFELETERVADMIERWFYRALYREQSPFKIYNKYNDFGVKRFLSFFKHPNWKTAQIIAGTAFIISKEEHKEVMEEIRTESSGVYYQFNIHKQWSYLGSVYVRTKYGVIFKTSSSENLPDYFHAKCEGGVLIVKE